MATQNETNFILEMPTFLCLLERATRVTSSSMDFSPSSCFRRNVLDILYQASTLVTLLSFLKLIYSSSNPKINRRLIILAVFMTISYPRTQWKSRTWNTFCYQLLRGMGGSYQYNALILWPCVVSTSLGQKLAQGKCLFLYIGYSGLILLQEWSLLIGVRTETLLFQGRWTSWKSIPIKWVQPLTGPCCLNKQVNSVFQNWAGWVIQVV